MKEMDENCFHFYVAPLNKEIARSVYISLEINFVSRPIFNNLFFFSQIPKQKGNAEKLNIRCRYQA